MKKLLSLLAELEHNIANASITNTTISQEIGRAHV